MLQPAWLWIQAMEDKKEGEKIEEISPFSKGPDCVLNKVVCIVG